MALSEARKRANMKYDAEHRGQISVKLKKETMLLFKELCAQNGDTVNGVLCSAIEAYISDHTPI